jgi:hypothetical protein
VAILRLTPLIAALAVATGCGSDGDGPSTKARTTSPPTPSKATTETVRPPPPADYAAEAERFVRRYYRLLNGRDFDRAWGSLAPSLQARLGPRERWEAGYELTEGTTPESVATRAADSHHAEVSLTFRSDDLDECGDHIPQRFEGSWSLERNGDSWLATNAVISKTAGAEPVRDPEQCGDTWTTVTPPPEYEPPDEGFSYVPDSDPGEPLYVPPIDFCDTHDCIPNFYNGTGYPVQCQDGSWSNSGGRPGACSWHGGESGR